MSTTSATQPVPTTRLTATTPITTVATTFPTIGAMKITTTEASDVVQAGNDEKLHILLSLSCFDPSWPVFNDKTLIHYVNRFGMSATQIRVISYKMTHYFTYVDEIR